MVDAGCDMIEIGLPYSDPVMDGPTIQAAAQRALDGGVRTRDVLRTVEAVAATGTPTLVMTYWNPVERYGVDRFAADLAGAGGAGLITPDLTPDSAAPWIAAGVVLAAALIGGDIETPPGLRSRAEALTALLPPVAKS